MVMIFASDKAREFLLRHGFVITCRKNKRSHVGKDWMTDKRGGKKIADVKVFNFQIIDQIPANKWRAFYLGDQLLSFVRWSGFASLGEWVNEIKRLNQGRLFDTYYLYLVVKW